jgi:hypothetical protein
MTAGLDSGRIETRTMVLNLKLKTM